MNHCERQWTFKQGKDWAKDSKKRFRATPLLLAAAMVSITDGALKAHAEAALEEVVVTAQKREQNLQDVGISITALSGDAMRSFGYTNSTEIVAQTPGVQNFSTQGSGAAASMYIRGVGLNDFGDAHESPVVAYADEFYLLPQTALDFGLFDLDRVEILRGPQGTLFGRNSTGGLVHYITNKPTDEFEAYIDMTYSRFDEIRVEGVVSGPLSSGLSGRVSVLSHQADGYIKNRNPAFDDGSDIDTKAVRAQLQYETDSLKVVGKLNYGERDVIPLYTDHETISADSNGLFFVDPTAVDLNGFNERQLGVEGPSEVFTSDPQRLESESSHTLLRIEKDFGDISFISITGYLDLERDNIEDCDGSALRTCTSAFPFETEEWTQELRLEGGSDPFRWTTGLFYLSQDAEARPQATFRIAALAPVPITLDAPWELETQSWSVFAQGEYDLAEDWTVIGGVRFTSDSKEFEEEFRTIGDFANPEVDNFTRANVGDLTERDDDLVSAKVELDWTPTEDLLIYAAISRGTKAGGFNNGFFSIPTVDGVQYKDETLMAYELGFKSTFYSNRVRLNGAVFYYDYSDFQTFNWTGLGGAISSSDASSYGAELELTLAPTERLDLSLGLALLDSEVEDVDNGTITRDVEMAFAPAFDITGLARYTWPLADADLSAQFDFNYTDERYNNNFNDPASQLDTNYTANTRLTYKTYQWEVSVFVKNLTDQTNAIKTFVFPFGYRQAVYAPPRRVGVSFRYHWD